MNGMNGMNTEPPSKALASWQALAPRERQMLLGIGLVLGIALLWFVLLAPALKLLGSASAQKNEAAAQLAQVQKAAAQIQSLATANTLPYDAANQALARNTQDYLAAHARISAAGDLSTVTLDHADAHALAQWLAAVRNNAKAIPTSADLKADAPNASGTWSGSISLRLPPRN